MKACYALGMSIRLARLTDAPQLATLLGQLGYPSTVAEVEARLPALLADPEGAVFVATDDADVAIGCLHACVRRQLTSAPFVQVASLVVGADRRGAGVGAALLANAEEWARAQGVGLVGLRCNVTRVRAHRFYLRAGYTLAKTSHLFSRGL